MRTALDLPEELVESARKAPGFKSKRHTVVVALRELVRRHRIEELNGLLGPHRALDDAFSRMERFRLVERSEP